MSNQVELDSGEMKDFLKHIISNNRFLQEKNALHNGVSTEVIGESGLGKTSTVLQVAEELKVVKKGKMVSVQISESEVVKIRKNLVKAIVNKANPKTRKMG